MKTHKLQTEFTRVATELNVFGTELLKRLDSYLMFQVSLSLQVVLYTLTLFTQRPLSGGPP